jgi:hypothetical protein
MPNWHVVLGGTAAAVKLAAKATAFSLVLFLVLLIVFHGHIIDAIYKNVDDLNDGEMPTTVTSYPSGPEVVGIIGGSGEGLNCSLPRGLDVFFDGSPDADGRRHLVRQRFRQACVAHDLCYRHGLATYGYSQNDCDRILQNQAFRLCKYIRNESKTADSERCQQDSKMILAGVSMGGFESYRAWDRSTYFEFDSDPTRSNGFSVSRVVDHPFKSGDPVKYGDEAPQVILRFANRRFNLTVDCVTCEDKGILEWSEDPGNVSNELRSVNLQSRPEALKGRELSLAMTQPIWLPPRRDHAAPHLLVDGAGKHHLIWLSRTNIENTVSCMVWADAARLLTYTLPKTDACHVGARSQLTMVQSEIYASSPLPLALPDARRPEDILATGLTPQRGRDFSLSLCMWSERIRATGEHTGGDEPTCTLLRDPTISAGSGLGAFQNFAVVRPGQEVFFARDVTLPRASNWLTGFFEHVGGNIYSTKGSIIVLDVTAPKAPLDGPGVATIKKVSRFRIDDRFDPMMPMTRTKDDLRFLSLLASKTSLGIHLSDFAEANPVPHEVGVTAADAKLKLHPSWAERPALILETNETPSKTKLVFSRGHLETDPDTLVDTVRLEAMVLERDLSGPAGKPFSVAGTAVCKVRYRIERPNPDFRCSRIFDRKRGMRPSPAAMMKASQLLVGRFGEADELGLAFADACVDQRPIVLMPSSDGAYDVIASARTAKQPNLTREVDCVPFDARACVEHAMEKEPRGRCGSDD